MHIAFTGHRNANITDEALSAIADQFPGAIWLHGGAHGVDSDVQRFANHHGIEQLVYRPDYAHYGKAAPLIRNRAIVEQCDMLIAVYDNRPSGGTAYTIKYARDRQKPVQIIPV